MGCPGNSRTSSCASCWTATFGACVYRQKPVGHVPLVKVVYAKHNSELGLGACKHHMGLLNSEDGSIEMFLMLNGHIGQYTHFEINKPSKMLCGEQDLLLLP